MSLPISIPAVRPSLNERYSYESCTSISSYGSLRLISRNPSRPSVLTNKLSPENAIPMKSDEKIECCLILTSLPSVRNCASAPPGSNISSNLITRSMISRSMTSTPDLIHSATTSSSTTPLLSPEAMANTIEVPTFICLSPAGSQLPMTDKSELARNELFHTLPAEDQYLLYLRDDVGVLDWGRVVEMMSEKGYTVLLKGLRTRYCTLKRDIDISLRNAMQVLNTTQEEVDNLLGSQKCRTRKMNSFGRKTIGNRLRVFEEEEDDRGVDQAVWGELAATLRASGLR